MLLLVSWICSGWFVECCELKMGPETKGGEREGDRRVGGWERMSILEYLSKVTGITLVGKEYKKLPFFCKVSVFGSWGRDRHLPQLNRY